MYARTNTGSTHGDFQDRNGVNYVSSSESFGHCSQLFWKKDPNDSGTTFIRCDFCSKPYTNYMSLRNHMRIHGQKRYMCDLCGKAFRLARYLRNHQRIHDDGPNRFDCPSCCKSYRTMLELAQHRCSAAATNQVRRWKVALLMARD
ncbi:hypothetical protein GOODEAATRI_021815 [Goodea atripinnis]|uniref:C2H2-type domain-containing protein n=1 Tax=Goodea atripinnis TaxID=208336 RepID=A0ABV0P6T9_9TELE